VLTREPTNADAILGLTEVAIAAGDTAAARSQLAKPPATDNPPPHTPRRGAPDPAPPGQPPGATHPGLYISQQRIPRTKSSYAWPDMKESAREGGGEGGGG
ncbi:tetratricopeptide repeat protein, partial [Escherichia coli]|uniref:tetratricopeptide repeat protein n=1 Tax=Escherichia coli TaxID=562 RepID=UPI0035E3ED6F